MRVLLNLAALLLIAIVAVGFYQGWFHFSTTRTDNTSSATVTMDQDKIRVDEGKARERIAEFGEKAKDKTGGQADKVQKRERD
ncbi:MAG: hypothetical protein ABFC77_10020 [Thermoguttaceae bacterium]